MSHAPDLPGLSPVIQQMRCSSADVASLLLTGPQYPTTLGAVTFVGRIVEEGNLFQATIFSFYPDTVRGTRVTSGAVSPFPVRTSFSLGGDTYSFRGGGVEDVGGATLHAVEPTGVLTWVIKGWWAFSSLFLQPLGQGGVYAASFSRALHAETLRNTDSVIAVVALRPDVLLVAPTWPASFDGTPRVARYIRVDGPVLPPTDPLPNKGLAASQGRGQTVLIKIAEKGELKVPLNPSRPVTAKGLPTVVADVPMTVMNPHYLCGKYEALGDDPSLSRENWWEVLGRGGYG